MRERYKINECFYSVQGEGKRAGTANVFVRFTGCNMQCAQEAGPKSPGGFDCDTEFESGEWMTPVELVARIEAEAMKCGMIVAGSGPACPWLILTGGEPALQVDLGLCNFLHDAGYKLAIETNGSIELPKHAPGSGLFTSIEARLGLYALDWITLSPKVAEHAVRQPVAHELKYVRGAGQALPKPAAQALHKQLSPAFNGLVADREAIRACVDLVKQNPDWSLSVQLHKSWGVR